MEAQHGTILVTDSLFIEKDHEVTLRAAGYVVERLCDPKASEDELIQALKGKVGYILGGLELVTDRVIESCSSLKVIAFTGSDWRAFIPGHEEARRRGIAICYCPGAVSQSVAELAIAGFLLMARGLLRLGRGGTSTFLTTRSIADYRVGIVGMGPLGTALTKQLQGLGAPLIRYTNRTRYHDIEQNGIAWAPIEQLFAESDVVFLAASSARGSRYVSEGLLKALPDGAIVVNCSFEDAIDSAALAREVAAGRISCFQDGKPEDPGLLALPTERFYWTHMSGYNTRSALRRASDMATASVLNVLKGSFDPHRV